MKKIVCISVLAALVALLSACPSSDPVNLANPLGLVSPFNCPIGSVIAPQGTLVQGTCAYGQGLDPATNQCVAGTPCQGLGLVGTGTVSSYYNSLNIISKSVYENLMAEVFGFCQKSLAFGTAACTHYSDNISVNIDTLVPSGGIVSGMNSVYVTIYAGVERLPLVLPASYYPINNNTGFQLIANGYPFKVTVNTGVLGTDTSLNVHLFYNSGEFANGYVNQYR